MSLAAGAQIGRYEILAPLGAGGMGEVYYARDPQLERPVAIKVLTSTRDVTALQFERFQREARAIARITHPHICTIYDVGDVDGLPFLVMELLEGESLAQRLERGPLGVDRALVCASQLAAALDAAHKKGVIHRDLKPGNVILTAGGAKLLDFGLAKLRDADRADNINHSTQTLHLTEQGAILGTLPYMAPEQVEGREVDARTDIFALGVMLYEMALGRPPFEGGSSASLIAAILMHDPQPLSGILPAVPTSVDRVVQKCLAKSPDERWQSAADLSAALQWSRDDVTVPSRAARAADQPRRFSRTVVAALAAGAAIGALAVWSLVSAGDVDNLTVAAARFTPLTFRTGTVTAARFAPDGETVIYSAAWGGDPYAVFMTRRGSTESRALNITGARLLSVSSTGEVAFLRGSHDAIKLLAPLGTGTLARVAIAGGAPREILDDVIAADWAANGDLAVVRQGQVEFPLGTTIHGAHRFTQVRIAPDGQRLALVEGRNHIVVLDRSGQKRTLSSGWDNATLSWSPSGQEVWFTANRGGNDGSTLALRAVSLAGKERVIVPTAGSFGSILDVSSDGRVLMATHAARMGCSCLAPGQTRPRELSWLDGSAPEALSSDGQSVLLSELLRGAGTNGAFYLRRTDGSDAIRLGEGYGEDLSPDGKWVLATARTRQHWIIVPTGPGSPRTLPGGPLVARNEANFLPNGRQVVFGGREKNRGSRIYVQDIESGSIRAISPENVATRGLASVDSRYVIGWTIGPNAQHFKYAVDESAPIPLPYLVRGDVPLQLSADESTLYVWRTAVWPPAVDRVNTATGQRELWKIIQPADPAGVDSVIRILITPDGTSYCHDYVRFFSDLFIVEGVK